MFLDVDALRMSKKSLRIRFMVTRSRPWIADWYLLFARAQSGVAQFQEKWKIVIGQQK